MSTLPTHNISVTSNETLVLRTPRNMATRGRSCYGQYEHIIAKWKIVREHCYWSHACKTTFGESVGSANGKIEENIREGWGVNRKGRTQEEIRSSDFFFCVDGGHRVISNAWLTDGVKPSWNECNLLKVSRTQVVIWWGYLIGGEG